MAGSVDDNLSRKTGGYKQAGQGFLSIEQRQQLLISRLLPCVLCCDLRPQQHGYKRVWPMLYLINSPKKTKELLSLVDICLVRLKAGVYL